MNFDFITELASINISEKVITEPGLNENWGTHNVKSDQQYIWDEQIRELSNIIATYDPTKPAPPYLMYAAEVASWQEGIKNKDIRPRAQDQISKEWLLIDSGAQLSAWPRNRVPEAVIDPYISI